MRKSRQRVAGLMVGFWVVLLLAQAVWAQNRINTTPEGVALHGYDVVAYFTLGKATKGDRQFSYDWQGATWHFANARHRDAFSADPQAYAPRYGGY